MDLSTGQLIIEVYWIALKGFGLYSTLNWAQRDSNPRPTAPQAAILSKLNYEPDKDIDDDVSTKYELTPTFLILIDFQYFVFAYNIPNTYKISNAKVLIFNESISRIYHASNTYQS